MSDSENPTAASGDPTDPGKRIGNGEREAAIVALRAHHAEGRLDSQEYEERSVQARQARTWADLDPLFTDLPEPHPVPGAIAPPAATPTAVGPDPAGPPAPAQPTGVSSALEHRGGLIPEPWAAWLMALTPFAALIVFLITDDWEWFLAIPIAGIIIYGPDGHNQGRDRDRKRDRRRNR